MAVTLGAFTFGFLEIPEEMPFSGGKHLQVHKLIGGDRVFDDMGDDPDQIEWSGTFLGGDASTRARVLDAMKQGGGQYLLTWGSFARQVVIRHFKPRYHYEFRVSFSICCEVVPTQPDIDPGLADLIAADFAVLDGLSLAAGPAALIGAAQAAVTTAAIAAPTGLFIDAPIPAVQTASAAVTAASMALNSSVDLADAAIPQADLSTTTAASPVDAVAALSGLVTATGAVADTKQAAGYLGRVSGNVAPSGSKSVTVVNGNLFELATHYLNDATAWGRIADLNSIPGIPPEFIVAGPTAIIIPRNVSGSDDGTVGTPPETILFGLSP